MEVFVLKCPCDFFIVCYFTASEWTFIDTLSWPDFFFITDSRRSCHSSCTCFSDAYDHFSDTWV